MTNVHKLNDTNFQLVLIQLLQLVLMFHVLGWSPSYDGAKIIFSGNWNLSDLEELTNIFVQEKVTVSATVPAVFIAMLEIIRKMKKKTLLK